MTGRLIPYNVYKLYKSFQVEKLCFEIKKKIEFQSLNI